MMDGCRHVIVGIVQIIKHQMQTVCWRESLRADDSPAAALVSFDPRFFRTAAAVIRGHHVEPDENTLGGISTNDVLFWLDSMAEHCHGDLHHLTRGMFFVCSCFNHNPDIDP